ncbi:hypothetical protein PVAP13_3KG463900 [Panicum virgatum]|uniref:Uncharacterized protein n=1 Tax=Panicum virgatum TaxID=38727 RepID=A0A8T0V5N9_PANVG|nr:hypothetical protein PVAP13_3KG463900 [Panicum virgatum]
MPGDRKNPSKSREHHSSFPFVFPVPQQGAAASIRWRSDGFRSAGDGFRTGNTGFRRLGGGAASGRREVAERAAEAAGFAGSAADFGYIRAKSGVWASERPPLPPPYAFLHPPPPPPPRCHGMVWLSAVGVLDLLIRICWHICMDLVRTQMHQLI